MSPIVNKAIENALLKSGFIPGYTISLLIRTFITLGFIVGIVAFVIYFIIGAIKWISSGGDKGRVQEAKSQITHALIGLTILLSLYIITSLVGNIFGIDLLNLPLDFGFSSSSSGGNPGPGGPIKPGK